MLFLIVSIVLASADVDDNVIVNIVHAAKNDSVIIMSRIASDNAPMQNSKLTLIRSPTMAVFYPPKAVDLHIEGTVILNGNIGIDGHYTNVSASMRYPQTLLMDAAVKTAEQMLFKPATNDHGDPIAVLHQMELRYILKKNVSDVTNSDYKKFIEPEFSNDARAQGHHGSVSVTGVIDSTGHLSHATIFETSRSPILDTAALKAATQSDYIVYKDKSGHSGFREVILPKYGFYNHFWKSNEHNALNYSCDQVLKDQRWWHATWPEKMPDPFKQWLMDLSWFNDHDDNGKSKPAQTSLASFEDRWQAASQLCETQPGSLFIDLFKPEGDTAREATERTLKAVSTSLR